MAGGQGSRLRPLTCDRPKPMVPVANRPIMEYAVDLLIGQGIKDIGITLQYLPEQIMDHFGDGSVFGVNMQYFIEEVPLGTAGSVKNAAEFLDETFVVVSGDALTDFNLMEAIEFHYEKGAIATLVLTEVPSPLEYGVVITEKDGRIKRFLEKPGWGEVFSDWVNTGIYILEPEVLNYFDFGVKYDFSKNLFPQLLENGEVVCGCLLSGYWCDIGNLDQYLQAHMDILAGKVKVEHRGTLIKDNTAVLHPNISKKATISGPVLLGENCRIEDGAFVAPYSVIGDNVVLDKEASIKRSVIWNNAYIGKSAAIRGAVIGRGVTIKPGANILEGAAVGDNSLINERSMIKPNVKLWPSKNVEAGAVVKESVVWGTKHKKELFGTEGVPGLVNRDITPELGAKLGAAYGSILKEASIVTVSSDGQPVTRMIKNALATGLISTGVEVNDLGDVTTPVNRFAVRKLGTKGGIHVKSDLQNMQKCWIQFLNEDGINVDRNIERKIESMFAREEFRRVKSGQIGEVLSITRYAHTYLNYILSGADSEAIRKLDITMVVDARGSVLNTLVSSLAERLNWNLIDFEGNIEAGSPSFSQRRKYIGNMAELVKKYGGHLGVMFDNNGEKILLVDDRGRVIDEHTFVALMVLILMKAKRGRTVVVPVTASEVVEKVVKKYGGKVVRTKTAPWAVMQDALKHEEDTAGGYSQFFFQNDALYAVVKITEFLAKENTTLSELVDEIPDFYIKVETAECPWEKKGRVMRSLIEETDRDMELIDGVKIRHDNGWTLLLPHADEPLYNIYSEGSDFETAEELSNIYKDKIKKIIHG